MKKLLLIVLTVLALPVMANVTSLDTTKAKFDLNDSVKNLALVTNSFTPKGQQNPDIAAFVMTQQITTRLDHLVAEGLNNNLSCENISSVIFDQYTKTMPTEDLKTDIQKKLAEKFVDSVTDYTDTTCKFITQ